MSIENPQDGSYSVEQIEALIRERDEAKVLADKFKKDVDNVVSELTDIRKKKQEVETELGKIKTSLPPADEVEQKIARALAEKQSKDAERERAEAMEEFLSRRKEFSKDQDPSGLLKSELERKLSMFNLSAVMSKRDMLAVLEDAAGLVVKTPARSANDAPYASVPAGGGAQPPVGTDSAISDKERAMMQRLGWDNKKFLSMKASHPDFVEQMINY